MLQGSLQSLSLINTAVSTAAQRRWTEESSASTKVIHPCHLGVYILEFALQLRQKQTQLSREPGDGSLALHLCTLERIHLSRISFFSYHVHNQSWLLPFK